MVKFIELLQYIGMIHDVSTCSCCKRQMESVQVYKKDENMICLCGVCRDFIEELLE